jgi:hypothetical protein
MYSGHMHRHKEDRPGPPRDFDLPHGRTRKDAVVLSTNSWDDDILPFKRCLIRGARYVLGIL